MILIYLLYLYYELFIYLGLILILFVLLLTNTLILVLKMRDQLGNKLTTFERFQVTAFFRFVIHYQGSET